MVHLAQVSLYWLVRAIHPLLIPICFVCAWTIIAISVWSVWAAIRDSVNKAKQMHQIPCANCRFFTGNYHLKCPVHPTKALSNEAINCPDFETSATYVFTSQQDL